MEGLDHFGSVGSDGVRPGEPVGGANHPLLGAAIAGRSCNITDATPKVIAVAKVRANIVIHICSSIA